MTLKSILIVLCVIVVISVQEISCGSVLVGRQKRMNAERLRKRQTFAVASAPSPYTAPAPAAGGSMLPAIPTLPDTSNVFASLNSVSGLTQQIPNLTGGQKPAAPAYYPAAAAPAAPPAASSGGGDKGGKEADDEPDEDEDND